MILKDREGFMVDPLVVKTMTWVDGGPDHDVHYIATLTIDDGSSLIAFYDDYNDVREDAAMINEFQFREPLMEKSIVVKDHKPLGRTCPEIQVYDGLTEDRYDGWFSKGKGEV